MGGVWPLGRPWDNWHRPPPSIQATKSSLFLIIITPASPSSSLLKAIGKIQENQIKYTFFANHGHSYFYEILAEVKFHCASGDIWICESRLKFTLFSAPLISQANCSPFISAALIYFLPKAPTHVPATEIKTLLSQFVNLNSFSIDHVYFADFQTLFDLFNIVLEQSHLGGKDHPQMTRQ